MFEHIVSCISQIANFFQGQ